MAETMIDRVAKAIKAETDKFDMPVNLYIEPEAGARFERDNPGKDRFLDAELDELESYRLIARAAIEAVRLGIQDMDANPPSPWFWPDGSSTAFLRLDEALKKILE
ncbi:hypothetical protein [Agrobacterium tumefaciens]|uniref:hypothetical protein n=1 Tax=Agrobacterium tumefaciens TaxID=358 RepID=UPI0021D367B9|nr:hypothetical protein [Agrobacterium tumefaciens]UXS24197.1 hypothetical protein FY153_06895 [Agrobacterium tumefaciens]UXS52363.1 hypothetical protein FY148_06700 [Agrobacterium tumefaciens]UXS62609.1 hypothetical protein FY147_06700 [Agrobacterium tumefaciens]